MKPYLKWVGNKYKLIPNIQRIMPPDFNDYYEPFLGSGALFFYQSEGDSKDIYSKRNYFLSDANEQLINCHKVVASDLQGLRRELAFFSENDSLDFYNEQRLLTTRKISKGTRAAARFIYFNRRAYGGMWRVNASGMFNVPKSPDQNAELWNISIKRCSKLLRRADICYHDYRDINPRRGDLVFLDPPYYPLSSSSNFTSYTKNRWTTESHEELFEFLHVLDNKGVKFIMTNNDCDFVRGRIMRLGLKSDSALVYRYIDALSYRDGSKKKDRDRVSELLIYNF